MAVGIAGAIPWLLMVTLAVCEQLKASLTSTVYVPGDNPLMLDVVALLLHR
jgi:hypothetical protein